MYITMAYPCRDCPRLDHQELRPALQRSGDQVSSGLQFHDRHAQADAVFLTRCRSEQAASLHANETCFIALFCAYVLVYATDIDGFEF